MKFYKGALFSIILDIILCNNSGKVLDIISSIMRRTVLECGAEVPFSDKIFEDFREFWEPDYSLRYEETGCVFHCVLLKLDLIDVRAGLRMQNLKMFAEAITAYNNSTVQITNDLIKIYEDCKGSIQFEEFCVDGLQLAKCLRETVFQMNGKPKDDILNFYNHVEL